MKTMKIKSHLKTQNKSDHKQNKKQIFNNQLLKNDHQNKIQSMIIIIVDSNQK
jgi:hypothetical protein